MNGNVKVPTEKYVVTENADGTVTVTPAKIVNTASVLRQLH